MTLSFLELYAPEFLREEVEKHLTDLRQRAGLSWKAAEELLSFVAGYLTIVPKEAVLSEWERASRAMADVDARDVAYVATALSVRCDGIWSEDAHLKRQDLVPCWTTRELLAALRAGGLRL